jgi:osomolarity two-component system response regulator SKN7
MNDVLPKPFTKEGMLRALEKHLPQFKKENQGQYANAPLQHPAGLMAPNQAQPPLGLNMAQLAANQPIKEDPSPGKSPATAGPWQSPNQITGPPPINAQVPYMQQGNGAYAMTPTHASHPQFPPNPAMVAPRGAPPQHRRVMSDMSGGPAPDEHADKRQRMFAPQQGPFPQ